MPISNKPKISNKPGQQDNCRFNFYAFSAARDALAKIIEIEGVGKKILIPAFIGYSVREGSGIFDPIKNSGIQYEFYRMNEGLLIDKSGIEKAIKNNPESILLLVHYWGFIDPACNSIKDYAKEHDCIIVEDFAHGLFTFFKTPSVDFDYGFFSLHKMFHYESGGVLIASKKMPGLAEYDNKFYEYNLTQIIKIRITNYQHVLAEIKLHAHPAITVLRDDMGNNVPQTFPILLRDNAMKDFLYFKMNDAGYGVVSLYHQLIENVDLTYQIERDVSSRILNLPIHQDATLKELSEMLAFLFTLCDEYVSHN